MADDGPRRDPLRRGRRAGGRPDRSRLGFPVKDCLLLHGHYGYAQEFPFEQRLRDVMAVEIDDGTAQIQKIIIARERYGKEFLAYRR